MGIPSNEVYNLIENARKDRYLFLGKVFPDSNIFEVTDNTENLQQLFTLDIPKSTFAVGQSISAIDFTSYVAELESIHQAGINLHNLDPHTVIMKGDILVLFILSDQVDRIKEFVLLDL